jgi:hypothetical protein
MATNAVPVSADQKDEEGVQETKTFVPGVGNVTIYIKVEKTDDVDEKTTKDVETYTFSMPVEVEEEVEVTDAEGDPVLNEDGSKKLTTEKFWRTTHFEVDLSPANRDKLLKALAPFAKNAREKVLTVSQAPARSYSAPALPDGVDTAAVRKWAQENNIKVDGKPINEKGRVPASFIEKYKEAHPSA